MPKPPTKTQICLRVPIDTLAEIRAEAATKSQSVSEIVRGLWLLRRRVRDLPDDRRMAIVDTLHSNQVIEFIDLKENGDA